MDTELFFRIVVTGLGATLIMDIWSMVQKHVLSIPSLDYALVGRWVLWMPRGMFHHDTIVTTTPMRGEKAAGWVAHYVTGVLFSFIPLVLNGATWFWQPSLVAALLAGMLSLFAPFLIMQPLLGFGVAAANPPRPGRARFLSALTHLAYGFGLYITAKVIVVFAA
ncbi:DUF2938 family protein [Buttiauxella sp. A111]|uniref:DUF2938 family protein n=1 Tax=Buttiauxella sp. A111 TaxID=2563088 RepID=UPI0010EA435C|nr:DUF2938 family protein [Buttiauxella sp. A111]GDX06283.1 DUF2938 domain-containing protein [Buttiauxella sp. A111]